MPHSIIKTFFFVVLGMVPIFGFADISQSDATQAYGYVSAEELALEIDRRRMDIERTEERLARLSVREMELLSKKQLSEREAEKIKQKVILRTRLFYRLSKSGGSLRYLLGSSSATQFLKRLALLRHLLQGTLEAQRQSHLHYAKITAEIEEVTVEKTSAVQILAELQSVLAELTLEQSNRSHKNISGN